MVLPPSFITDRVVPEDRWDMRPLDFVMISQNTALSVYVSHRRGGPRLAGKFSEVDAEEGLKTQPGAINRSAVGPGVLAFNVSK